MQVAVDERLRVVHKFKLDLGDGQLERLVLVELLLHEVGNGREDVVAVVAVVIRLGQHQILGDFAQLGVDKALDHGLLFLVLHGHVGGLEQGVDHVGRNILRKAREGFMAHERIAHQGVVGKIFHRAGAHHGIIAIDFGHQTGRVLVLNLENFALDAVPVGGYLHLCGNAKRHAGLLNDDGLAGGFLDDAEDVVQVAVADFFDGQHGFRREEIGVLGLDVFDDVGFLHQKIGVETRHNAGLPFYLVFIVSKGAIIGTRCSGNPWGRSRAGRAVPPTWGAASARWKNSGWGSRC